MTEDKIILLDVNTANKIAAGEVVEKPASVVKELVENALDAGARTINAEIDGGGMKYIRVTDDGSGMSENDARLAVLRHATSKLKQASDLPQVKTLGFRGEALPSIAAVSRFTLLTRPPEYDLAVKIKLEGGELIEATHTGGGLGTSVIAEDLFFNLPARRKFLRKESTEGRYISELLTKLALSRPDVKFSLVSGGREVLNTPGNGSLMETIAGLYGRRTGEDLLPICYEQDGVSISGYAGKPSLLKSSRQWQTFIVNNRVIASRAISRALDHAYHAQLPKTGYPFAVINLILDTEQIDVNVHPQKSELKFSDEQAIFRAIHRAVSATLAKPLESNFSTGRLPEWSAPETVDQTALFPEKKPVEYDTDSWHPAPYTIRETLSPYDRNIRDFAEMRRQTIACPRDDTGSALIKDVWPLGQLDHRYIVAQSQDALYIIDQHAAHERIVFERLAAGREHSHIQELLTPIYIQLPAGDIDLALDNIATFDSLCFTLDAAGPDTIKLTAVPADLAMEELSDFIKSALMFLSQCKKPDPAALRQELLTMAACKAAIKSGQPLNMREMRELLAQLWRTQSPFTCPHGRPVIIEYSRPQLDRLFKRT